LMKADAAFVPAGLPEIAIHFFLDSELKNRTLK